MSLNTPKTKSRNLRQEDLKEQYSQPEILQNIAPNSRGIYLIFKKIIDLITALLALIIFSPVWIIIAVIIKLTDGGKIIFAQERTGKNGKLFTCYKFRTMYPHVEGYEFAPTSLTDKRITKIGRLLRRTSLDEIPQFFNVLKGEMSLIGPRPEMEFITKKYKEKEKLRLLISPGITGLWQVMGRKDLPLHENVEYDLYYIEHQSIRLDLMIIFKTFHVIISGKGAY